jgi:hypothetical protein
MDLYQSQFDFQMFSTQVHDFNPGFSPNDVVWTVPLPRDNPLLLNFDAAEATVIGDLDLGDYTKIPNSLSLGASVPANVTFELRWSGPASREVSFRDTANGFRGLYKENSATLAWSATRAGFKFVSDAANTSKSVFAQLAQESNGIFF